MTTKEYLMQGYRLNNRIKIYQEEIERLRDLASSTRGISYDHEPTNPNKNTKSPFEGLLIEAYDMEQEMLQMLKMLIKLKSELMTVINGVPNKDESLVLYYRYIENYNWSQIADELGWDRKTIRTWHDKGLTHVTMPENPTIVDSYLS